MKTTITLNGSSCALCDLTEPVLLPETLELSFISSVYKMSNLVLIVTVKNGDVKRQYKASSSNEHTIDISELLFLGSLDIEISACTKSEPVKTWRVPSIFIKEINHELSAIPEMEELKAQIKLMATAIKDMKNYIDNQGA